MFTGIFPKCKINNFPPYRKGGSVIPAAVKTPGNKLVRIIMPGINMVAVKKPEKKFAKIDSDISKE